MYSQTRTKRFAGYLVVLWLALMLSGLPVAPVRAGTIDQMIDNTLADFSDGNFQRSALSSLEDTEAALRDQVGAVQLAPSGKLAEWGSSNPLPEAISDAGLTALGKRLYLIGGRTASASGLDSVQWATVTITNGQLLSPDGGSPWQNPSPLPATRYTAPTVRCTTREFAARSNAGVTSISTGGDTGFLYVVGGRVVDGGCTSQGVSSVAVQIGRVDANGTITWTRSELDLPTPSGDTGFNSVSLGNLDSAVTSVVTTNGKAFIYVFGGVARFLPPSGTTPNSAISKAVLYSEVNLSNGAILEWKRGPDIPVVGAGGVGLFGATAIAARFDIGGGSRATRDAIYLAGGKTSLTAANYNELVFRADVNPATGELTWDATPGEGDKAVGLSPRFRLGGVSFNSKLYMVAGAPSEGAPALDLVPTAVFLEDMSIDEIDNAPNSFFQGTNTGDKVLLAGRQSHSVALVRAQATTEEPNAAWVFVAGGNTGSAGAPDSSLYLGKVGGLEETNDDDVAPTGWYYSAPVNVRISNVDSRVLSVSWSTDINRTAAPNADIRMEYRTAISATGACDGQGIFTDNSWQVITDTADANIGAFNSTDGLNTYDFPSTVQATCFQYRAFIDRSSGTTSPSLLNVSLKKIIPGSVDLKVKELDPDVQNGNLGSITVVIENKNEFGDLITLPADLETRGGFFVDLCISEPNQPVAIPTLPITVGDGPPCSKAYAEVLRSQMQPNAVVTVTGWKYASGPNIDTPVANLTDLFPSAGTYQLLVVIDGKNFVSEGDSATSQQEQNNVGPLPVTEITIVTANPTTPDLYLPMIRRQVP